MNPAALPVVPMQARYYAVPDMLSFDFNDYAGGYDRQLQQALLENGRLNTENIMLKAEVVALGDRIKELEAENQKLFELLNLGCDTSSVPPSKGWKADAVPNSSETPADTDAGQGGIADSETPVSATAYIKGKGKKSPGGQKNHAPSFMRFDDVREGEDILHYPEKCAVCPRLDQCLEDGQLKKYFTGHDYDIEVIRTHRKHILHKVAECPIDGNPIHVDFPEVIGSQFYGTNVQLHVLAWHHIFHGSYERIGMAAKELLGLSLSAGTANAIIERVSAKILGSRFMDAVRFFILLFEVVMGADETSARVGGRNAWVHTAVTDNVTLLNAHWRRGYEGMIHAGLLQFFSQTLISDCLVSYFNDSFKFFHALCDGHILRELVAAAYFRGQCWAIDMFDLLLELLSEKREAVERGDKCLPQEYLDDATARYRQIIENGFKENPGVEKGKTFALLQRLSTNESSVLAFAVDFRVHFTNNASEISLRDLKVAMRVMGQFKTMAGLADYCIIQSFMDTCRKQGRNPYDMMRVVMSGGDVIEAVFGAEKSARIKEMIRLADIIAKGDQTEVDAAIAQMPQPLTEELLAAASHGIYSAYDAPPPEKTRSPSAIPKDKMQAARELNSNKKPGSTTASSAQPPQSGIEGAREKNKSKIRAGPKGA